MKKIFLTLFVCIVSMTMYAAGEVVYDGIYYSVGDDTATVLQQNLYWTPEGDIVIPEEIKDESGKTYTVTELGDNAFYTTSIETISIPGTIKTWGKNCVNSCKNLTKVTFGNDITSIGYCAFNQCYLLETIDLAYTNVERIEQQAFSMCTGLTTILLPSTLTWLDVGAFMMCSSVESLTCMAEIPPECSSDAFMGFSTSTCVLYVPIGCVDAYRAAPCWEDFKNIEEIEGLGDIPFTNGDIINVDDLYYKIVSIDNYTVEVTWGGTSASAGTETYVGELTIPTTVTCEGILFNVIGIGESAFRGNPELTAVSLTDDISYINAYAFEDCVGLTSMDIPSSISELKDGLFEGCTALESVEIPSSVTTIGNRAFYGCTSLEELTIPSNVTSLGNYAFACCDGLREITIPDNITSIGSYLLYNCTALEKASIGSGVTATSTHMFDSCSALTEVEFSDNITTLTDNTFTSCTGLTALTIPSSITKIEEYVFSRCSNLTTVEIPESVTSIGMYSFAMCSSLEDITIPESITIVTERLFSWCTGMTQVTLPETLTSIEANAFDSCTGLKLITSLNPIPPTCGSGAFNGVNNEDCQLLVPVDSKEVYAVTDTWKDFYNIVEMTVFSIKTIEATNVTDSSATLNGSVIAAYNDPIIERGFKYWTSDEDVQSVVVDTDEDGEMSYTLNSLTPETTYTYCAFAVTDSGTTYGEDMVFTTLQDTTTGINGIHISLDDENVEGIYSTSGQKLNTTVKGVNIIHYSDGTTKKVLVK